jgi:MFS family permease
MLLASLGVSIPNVALPTLADAFAAPFQAVQWVIIAYLLAVTILIVGVGRLGDVLGHRRVLLGGILLFTAASVLSGVAPTLWLLIAARAAQGAGAAILMALTVALVRDTVPKDRMGSAMGLLGTMSAIGTALGPSLGGLLVAGPGWRAIFLIMAPLGVVSFLLAQRSLPADGRKATIDRQGFDSLGMLLLGLALAAYALAMTVGGADFGPFSIGLLSAAMLAGGLFLLAETKAASPLIQLTAFRSGALSAGLVMNGLVSTVMMATLVVGPFYLSRALGLDAAAVGLVMSIGPVISALSGVPAGRIVDRLGAPVVVIAGLAAMAAGSVGLAVLPGLFGLAGYIAAIAVLTPGYQLFQAANNTAVMADAGAERRGVVSGLLSLSRNLGLITGASAMGALFAAAAAATDFGTANPEAVASGLRITFAVAAALVAIALILASASRGRVARVSVKSHSIQ